MNSPINYNWAYSKGKADRLKNLPYNNPYEPGTSSETGYCDGYNRILAGPFDEPNPPSEPKQVLESEQVENSQPDLKSECVGFTKHELILMGRSIQNLYDNTIKDICIEGSDLGNVAWFDYVKHLPNLVAKLRNLGLTTSLPNIGYPYMPLSGLTHNNRVALRDICKKLLQLTRKIVDRDNPYPARKEDILKVIDNFLVNWKHVAYVDLDYIAREFWSEQFYNDIRNRVCYTDPQFYTANLPSILLM